MKKGIIIKNILIMAVILAVVYISQNSGFAGLEQNVLSGSLQGLGSEYWAKGSSWVRDELFPKIGGEVQKRGDMAKEGIDEQKEKATESIGENIKNYFSGIVDSVLNIKKEDSKATETSAETCLPCQSSQTHIRPTLDLEADRWNVVKCW